MQQQNYLSAINDFNQVIMHDQSNFMAIKHKGFCFSMQKMFKQAIQCYNQIIKYILDTKEKSILLLEKGFCHLKLAQNLSAKQNFEEAIELSLKYQIILQILRINNQNQKQLTLLEIIRILILQQNYIMN